MKSQLIPDYIKPYWSCTINGKKYSYPSGTVQSVPDEVYDLIENERSNEPKPAPMKGFIGQVLTRTANGIELKDLPEELPKGGSNGQILRISGGVPTWSASKAAAEVWGFVKKGSAVADATSETVVTQLNALIASLVASGALTQYVSPATLVGDGDDADDDNEPVCGGDE